MNTEKRLFQRCINCVMDTTDSKIVFDENGKCDFCNDYQQNILPSWLKIRGNVEELTKISNKIKAAGKGKNYDCIIGMSGGVDSSYLCYVAKELMGLRPLVFIVDTGWNLDIANTNIDRIVKALDLDSYTEVIDWEEMKDLQLAFFKSQVPYQDLPQDHAIFASLYKYAIKNKIKYVLTGANNATECIRPPIEWVYQNDLTFIKDIHKQFGTRQLRKFPLLSMVTYRAIYPIFYDMKRIAPLNIVDYDKDKVKQLLTDKFGWQPYENKHYESVLTRFYEGYYLPHKFGYDKRKVYFSNLILTGQMKREEALAELAQQPYSDELINKDREHIARKLGISVDEFQEIIDGDNRTYRNYKNSWHFIQFCTIILRKLGTEKKKFR
ncbi:N-acetyl sugar amidotransferase [Bacillota bacterium]